MATKETVQRIRLVGGDQPLDATTVARRQPGGPLALADNLIPMRGALITRKSLLRVTGEPPAGLTTPLGLRVCIINNEPVVFAAWEHTDGDVRVYKYSYASGAWSEVTAPGYRFSPAVTKNVQFAQVKSAGEDIVVISNGVEDVLAYHVSDSTVRRQYYIAPPEEDRLRIWYKPYQLGSSANGWFQSSVSPVYSADDAGKFKLKDTGAPGGAGTGNGDIIQLEANSPTVGLRATVEIDTVGFDFTNGYQVIFHVDSPSVLLSTCRIQIGNGSGPTWTTIYDPTDVTAYDRIDVNGNWIALSVRNVSDGNKNAVRYIRFTWLAGATVFLLTFAGFRLGGKISATTAYSSTYYDSVNRQESGPNTPRSSIPRPGLSGVLPGLYVGNYQLPFDPNFFYVFACIHYASPQITVDKARIYRQSPDGEWKHVGDVNDNGGSLDDNTPDTDLTSTAMRPLPGLIPVPPARFLDVAANRLVCANVVLPVPPGEETLLSATPLTGSPQSVSPTAQPKRPTRLRVAGTTGTEAGTVTISGTDMLGSAIQQTFVLAGTTPVEGGLVFASINANGISLPAGTGSVLVESGSYASYSDRWYISRGDDPLRFTRVASLSDVWTGSFAATGGHSIVSMSVLQGGTGDRIIVFTADGNAYVYEGMDVSSLTTARERVPVPSVAPYAAIATAAGIAFIDGDRRLRILGSPADIGYPVWALLEKSYNLNKIFTTFTGKDLIISYSQTSDQNYDTLVLDAETGIWRTESSAFLRQAPFATRLGTTPSVYYQDSAGRFVVASGGNLDCDASTSPVSYRGIQVSVDTGVVDIAGANRTATVFGIWSEFDGIERNVGSLNQWARSGSSEVAIGYDVTSDITAGLTKIKFPGETDWRDVTAVSYSGGVTRVTFSGSDISPGVKNPVFSLDLTFRITAVHSSEQYEVKRAFVGSGRKQFRHAVRTDSRFRASAIRMEIETIAHANWALHAAGIEAELQELDPYE